MTEARKFAFAAHAAARSASTPQSVAAARAAGHAAATPHVRAHAKHAAAYAIKAAENKDSKREWQMGRLPADLLKNPQFK